MLYYLHCNGIACLYDDVRCVRTSSGYAGTDFFSYLASRTIVAATLETAINQLLEWLPPGTSPSDVLICTQSTHPEFFI